MKRRLIIADLKSNDNHGNCTGHYFSVAENYKECLSNSFDVKIAGGPIYNTRFKETDLLPLPYNMNVKHKTIKRKWCIFCNTVHLLRYVSKQDIVVLQQSATSTVLLYLVLLWFLSYSKNIYLIQYSISDVTGVIRGLIFRTARPLIKGFITTNESTGKYLGKHYCVVPDYIYPARKHKEEPVKNYDDMKYDFCVLGRISPEKGICEVAQLMSKSQYSIIIAGKPQNEELGSELKLICQNSPNIILELGFIDEIKYKCYLNESRYAILNYQSEYSVRTSGVVYDNIFSNVPVVARNCDALGFVESYKIGVIYDDISKFDFSKIMDQSFYGSLQKNIRTYKYTHFINI